MNVASSLLEHAYRQEEEIKALKVLPFNPELVPFLMTPNAAPTSKQKDRSEVDMSIFEGGDASLRNLRTVFTDKRQKVADKKDAVKERKEEREAAKVDKAATHDKASDAFALCDGLCASVV